MNMYVTLLDKNNNPIKFLLDGEQIDKLEMGDIGQIKCEKVFYEGDAFDFSHVDTMYKNNDGEAEEGEAFVITNKSNGKSYELGDIELTDIMEDDSMSAGVGLVQDILKMTDSIKDDIKKLDLEELLS